MSEIIWKLRDINEANNILMVLGKLPYEQVSELIGRLKSQTESQIQQDQKNASPGT